jgi:hypothetical protein
VERRFLTLLPVAWLPSAKSKTQRMLSALLEQESARFKWSILQGILDWQAVVCVPVKPAEPPLLPEQVPLFATPAALVVR